MKSQRRKALWLVKGIRRKIALELHSGGHDVVEYCRPNGVVETTAVRPNRQGQSCVAHFCKGGPMCANHNIIGVQIKTRHAGRSIRAVGNRYDAGALGRAG